MSKKKRGIGPRAVISVGTRKPVPGENPFTIPGFNIGETFRAGESEESWRVSKRKKRRPISQGKDK